MFTATPNSKTNALINVLNSQSPNTRTNAVNSINASRERDLRVSNCARKLMLKLVAIQDTKKTRKVF